MYLKAAITGIDGSGKSSLLDRLVSHPDFSLKATISRPKYVPGAWQVNAVPVHRRLFGAVDYLTLMGDRFNNGLLTGAVYAGMIVVGYKPAETIATRIYKPDLLITERDIVIDSAVYSAFYFPRIGGNVNTRLRIASLLTLTHLPDLVIYLSVDPEVALMRIQESLEKKRWMGRKFKPHIHETLEGLVALQTFFMNGLNSAAANGTEVIEVDANKESPEDMAARLAPMLIRYAQAFANSGKGKMGGHRSPRIDQNDTVSVMPSESPFSPSKISLLVMQ